MTDVRRRPNLRVVDEGTEGFPYPKCSLALRAAARAVDIAIAYGLYVIGGRAGLVMAFLYLLLGDGIFTGQSVGKRLFGVKVIHLPNRIAARFRESVLRNAPLGLVVLLRMMPDEPLPAPTVNTGPSGGMIAFVAGAVLIGGIEAWKVVTHPLGMRLGDLWADTQVVDGKEVAGGEVVVPGTHATRAPDRATLSSVGRAHHLGRDRP